MDILFVEDDDMIAAGVLYALEAEGYRVCHCGTVSAALTAAAEKRFQLALLDISLPDGSGFDVFAAVKSTKNKDIPMIFLTAAEDEGNTVKGLEMGADDYIKKPFRLRELMARIKTVLRRASIENKPEMIKLADIEISAIQGKVFKNGGEVILTALEYKLLLIFAMHRGQILSRNQLLSALWDDAGNFVNDNTLTVYIKRLREKLADGDGQAIIKTVRGIGYRAD